LNEEIRIHLAMQEEEFRRRGMDPAAARAAALREFGGVSQTKEEVRDRRGVPWLESTARDLRYGLRGLRRTPGFTIAAVLSLALGIGANTAIFSLFHTLMLRLLPVEKPHELVSLYRTAAEARATCPILSSRKSPDAATCSLASSPAPASPRPASPRVPARADNSPSASSSPCWA
jgi:hypothetical protein